MAEPITRGATGKRVKPLQTGIDRILGDREFKWRKVPIDGNAGRETFRAAHLALWLLGASNEQLRKIRAGYVTDHAYRILIGKKARSAAMKKRDRHRRDEAAKLRYAHHHPPSGLSAVNVTIASGSPHWGGSGDVVDQFVSPFMNNRGLPTGSGKRTPAYNASIGGSPTSDHLTTKLTTDARDYPTFSGEDDARALADEMGYTSWRANSYEGFNFQCDGHTFHAQILWGSGIAHGDHVHVGISLVA